MAQGRDADPDGQWIYPASQHLVRITQRLLGGGVDRPRRHAQSGIALERPQVVHCEPAAAGRYSQRRQQRIARTPLHQRLELLGGGRGQQERRDGPGSDPAPEWRQVGARVRNSRWRTGLAMGLAMIATVGVTGLSPAASASSKSPLLATLATSHALPVGLPGMPERPVIKVGDSSELDGVFCLTAANCWAVGYFVHGGALLDLVLHWTGV